MPCDAWNRCGGEALFHFTWREAANITICRANYFTVSEANDFTFCLDKTLWILGAERVKARSTALPAADEAVLWAGRNNEHCEALHRPQLLHIIRFRLWRKLIHYVPRPLPKRQAFSEPPYRATMFLTERVVDLSPTRRWQLSPTQIYEGCRLFILVLRIQQKPCKNDFNVVRKMQSVLKHDWHFANCVIYSDYKILLVWIEEALNGKSCCFTL